MADVPGLDHYGHRYDDKPRLASYWHQVDECLALGGQSCLVIGAGSGLVPWLLRRRGFTVVVLDIQIELDVDVLATVLAMPFATDAFDVVLCSQVLEHLPLADLDAALGELRRVAKNGCVLSLPDRSPYVKFHATFPRLRPGLYRRFNALRSIPRFEIPFEFDGEHHWELGTKGASAARIRKRLKGAGFDIDREFRVPEHPYHRFWRLR